jgi:hypothetical protein
MKNYCLVKFRVFDKGYKKLMNCKIVVLQEDLTKILSFLESNNRIVVYDEIKEFRGKNEIVEMLRQIKNDIEDENQLLLP